MSRCVQRSLNDPMASLHTPPSRLREHWFTLQKSTSSIHLCTMISLSCRRYYSHQEQHVEPRLHGLTAEKAERVQQNDEITARIIRIENMSNPDPLHDLVVGYTEFPGEMGIVPETATFRRFRALNTRNILYMQNELVMLETQLKKIESKDAENDRKKRKKNQIECSTAS